MHERTDIRFSDLTTLRLGGPADVVVLDDRLEIVAVHVGGREQIAV